MTNLVLSKILMGFLAVALVSATALFIFRVIKFAVRLFRFRLRFDDAMSFMYIVIMVSFCYLIGDWIN